MPFRTPKPLEAAILYALAAVVERNFLNYRSEAEIISALKRAGHHPSKNVFRLAMRRMEECEMILRAKRFVDGRVYTERQLEELVGCTNFKPEQVAAATVVFGVSGYYISKMLGDYLEEGQEPQLFSMRALAAAELFCQNAWERPAWAQRHCAQVAA